jgi:histidyl-tRNA synthetase
MVAAKRRELGFPLRWYSIPNLFRYEAPQRGRLREHWQLNADIFGVKGIEADIEMIVLAYNVMKNFGAKDEDFEIRIHTHGDKENLNQAIIGLEFSGINNIKIDETLKRGQAYYTGIVFEFFDTNKENPRSILGGGRYDNLMELFSSDQVYAVGFGAGDVTIKDFLETHELLPAYKPATNLFFALQGAPEVPTVVKFFDLSRKLQKIGVNLATDTSNRSSGDLYKTAEKLRIPFITLATEEMLNGGEIIIKNMVSREEHKIKIDQFEKVLEIFRK